MREELAKLPKMRICHLCGSTTAIEWNHALIYQGRQINELYAIVALCRQCHRGNQGTIFKEAKEVCEIEAIKNGLEHLKINYPKFNWEQRLKYLSSNKKK